MVSRYTGCKLAVCRLLTGCCKLQAASALGWRLQAIMPYFTYLLTYYTYLLYFTYLLITDLQWVPLPIKHSYALKGTRFTVYRYTGTQVYQ